MSLAESTATAIAFAWVGLVVGISFIEAPVKFRAPGVTVPIGLGIGRLVFKVVNAVEAVLAVLLAVSLAASPPAVTAQVALWLAAAVLLAQLAAVRPRLARRSDAVLAGENVGRSRAHHAYVALETVKVVALLVGGVALLTAA
jgi:hypothetical protein